MRANPSASLYRPLDAAEDSIRLVNLLPGIMNEQLYCTLSYGTTTTAGYEALSYAWGDKSVTRSITVNDMDFQVTLNLYQALQYLRLPDQSRVLWIDAICINQDDNVERCHQVQAMGDIYMNAVKVIVWLGESDADSDFAVRFINEISSTLKKAYRWYDEKDIELYGEFEYGSDADFSFNKNASDEMVDSWEDGECTNRIQDEFITKTGRRIYLTKYLELKYNDHWGSVCRLFKRPWWQRAWIVQEFVKARIVELRVGNNRISWMNLSDILGLLQKGFGLAELHWISNFDISVINDAADLMYHRRNWTKDIYDFRLLLEGQRYRLCLDPLDRIYSILSLAPPQIGQEITPDYTNQVVWLYCQVTRVYIMMKGNIDILRGSMGKTSILQLPSWCPNWSFGCPWSYLDKYLMPHPQIVSFSPDIETLTIPCCVHLDYIEDCQVQGTDANFEWVGNEDHSTCQLANSIDGKSTNETRSHYHTDCIRSARV